MAQEVEEDLDERAISYGEQEPDNYEEQPKVFDSHDVDNYDEEEEFRAGRARKKKKQKVEDDDDDN